MTFEECAEIILKHEGGYIHDVRDPGGETNYGISKRAYPDLNIKTLTRDDAIEIYRKDYWQKNQLDSLPAQIRLMYFDCAVNQGSGRARQLYTLAKTLAEPKDNKSLLYEFAKARIQHYGSLKTWAIYGVGWVKRVLDVAIRSL